MPLKLQVKLLRVLQEEIMRIGGTEHIQLNTRIVTATNQNIEKLVKEDKFREDLYYRLNVIPLTVPPLRKRKEDISALIKYYLKKFNDEFTIDKKFSLDLIELLEKHSWPGNVRQLKNIIERLVVMSSDDIITIDHLPREFKDDLNINRKYKIDLDQELNLQNAVIKIEKKVLKNAIQIADTTREIASLVGVSQPTIVRKINQYNLR